MNLLTYFYIKFKKEEKMKRALQKELNKSKKETDTVTLEEKDERVK